MTISDEILMAYVDGELDAAARTAVESAMSEDPRMAARVARHRALRLQVQTAYSAELSEEVPARLLAAAQGVAAQSAASQGATAQGAADAGATDWGAAGTEPAVAHPQDARAPLDRAVPRTAAARRPWRRWRAASAMAASVVVGVALGFLIWGRAESPLGRGAGGALVARGPLATALSEQLAAEPPRSPTVHIGISFLAKSGEYCRTFALPGEASSGLACRHDQEWRIQALARDGGGATGAAGYRTAGSTMTPMMLKLVEDQIAGEALDQSGERAARRRGWTAADRHRPGS